MLRLLRNLRGKLGKYGKCLCCGDHWNWKVPKAIVYPHSKGGLYVIAPVCKQCFEELPIEGAKGIMDFVNQAIVFQIAYNRSVFTQYEVDRLLKYTRRQVQEMKFRIDQARVWGRQGT